MSSERVITYAEYSDLLDKLVAKIQESGLAVKYVLGLPKGGLPIAVHLAHHLKLDFALWMPSFGKVPNILVVDDIVHTGATLTAYESFATATASLFYRETSTIKPTFFVEITKEWIKFPWERPNEVPNR